MHTHINVEELSEDSNWRAVRNSNQMGPWESIIFKHKDGFEAEYRINYRDLNDGVQFPVYWFLRTLENYDKWRDNEDRESE